MRKRPTKRFHKPERDRAIHQVLQAVRHLKAGEIARKTFLSPSTIYNWRSTRTKYPSHICLAELARLGGLEYQLVPRHASNGAKRHVYEEARA